MQQITTDYDKLLLNQIGDGNVQSYRILFDLYKEQLFTFAFSFTHSIVDAEEIVQDVFMKVWEARLILTNIDHPRNYLFTMTRNRTLDVLTKISRNQKMVEQVWVNIQEGENQTEHILQARESLNLINSAVAELSEKKQQIFKLSRYEGMNLDDISHNLGISKQTVKNNLSEILKQIKGYLKTHSAMLSAMF